MLQPIHALSAVLLLTLGIAQAETLEAVIDLSDQRMMVYVDGLEHYNWDISSGRMGYETPTGSYKPTWLSANHASTQYNDAPMPFAVFFNRGIAVHGTDALSKLG